MKFKTQERLTIAAIIGITLVNLAFWGGIIYLIIHFARKWW